MAFITNAEGNAFVQVKSNEPFDWLTQVGVGDVEIPSGDLTPHFKPDPLHSGQFKIEDHISGTPGSGTFTLTEPLVSIYNWLLEKKGRFNTKLNFVTRGVRSLPDNYEVSMLMLGCRFGGRRATAPVIANPQETAEARVQGSADVNYAAFQMLYPIAMQAISLTSTVPGTDIAWMPEEEETPTDLAIGKAKFGIYATDPTDPYDSEVYTTEDGEGSFAVVTDPFSTGAATSRVMILSQLQSPRYKLLAFRGESYSNAPAECAVSEDGGTTWTNNTISSVNNQHVNDAAFMNAVLFAVGTAGNIWKSKSFGDTWEDAATASSGENLNGIAFHEVANKGYAVGDSNEFLYTTDGGATWTEATGPDTAANLLTVAVNNMGHVFIGTNAGEIYVSYDAARSTPTWTSIKNHGSGTIDWIDFDPDNQYVGAYIYNSTSPVGSLYRSEDGGVTWRLVDDMPTNAGLTRGHIVDANTIYVIGNVYNGTTFMAKAQAIGL